MLFPEKGKLKFSFPTINIPIFESLTFLWPRLPPTVYLSKREREREEKKNTLNSTFYRNVYTMTNKCIILYPCDESDTVMYHEKKKM